MTREEQIIKYCEEMGFPMGSCSSINSIKAQTASDAIEWADATMIQKTCKWIRDNIDKDLIIYNNGSWKKVEEFIKSFKEAMEGE